LKVFSQSDQHPRATLAILAGGASSRMGVDKASMEIHGVPILRHLLTQLRWDGPKLLVRAPHQPLPPGAELFDRAVFDTVENQGPLRGILTALENADGDVVVVTVDMPAITRELLNQLMAHAESRPDLNGLMFRITSHGEPRVETFPSLFRQSGRDIIAKTLDENRRSVRGLLSDPTFATLSVPPDASTFAWMNLNTPDDLAEFEKTVVGS
jgi:molybdopterin-guanine dinucleotide biosynthesis protein A